MDSSVYSEILAEIRTFAAQAAHLAALQQFTVELIDRRLPLYNWTGFYMLDPADPEVLVLGPYVGAPTEHIRIPVTQGICGAAVAQGQTIIIDDVHSDPRYLACSLETRSEIVAPIRAFGRIVGEIDIDRHQASAFSPADRAFLEQCAEIIGHFIEQSTPAI